MGGTWSLNFIYHTLIGRILEYGTTRETRGTLSRELNGHILEFSSVRGVPLMRRVGMSPSLAYYEALHILAGQSGVRGYTRWGSKATAHALGDVFPGAYGPHVRNGLPAAVELLKFDNETRRCFLPIYELSDLQSSQVSPDVPCTLGYHFAVEGPTLVNTVLMRSSDAWLGLVYDTFIAALLAHLVRQAAELDVKDVDVRMMLLSSHLYDRDWEAAEALHRAGPPVAEVVPPLEVGPGRGGVVKLLHQVKIAEAIAARVLTAETPPEWRTEPWLAEQVLRKDAERSGLDTSSVLYGYLLGACSRVSRGLLELARTR